MEQAQDKEKEGDVARERMQRNYSLLPLTGPLTVGDLLDRAFRLYRSRFGLFLLTGAVLIAPVAIVSAIFLARFFANYMQTLDVLMREPPPEFGPFAFFSALSGDFAGVTLIGLLLAAAGAIVSLSLTAQAAEALRDGSLSLMAGLRRGGVALLRPAHTRERLRPETVK